MDGSKPRTEPLRTFHFPECTRAPPMVRPVALPVDVEAQTPLAETMWRPSSDPFDFERDNLPPKPTSDRMGPIAFPTGVSGVFVAASRRPPSNEARNVFPDGSLHLDCNLAPFFWIDCVNLPSIRETKGGLKQHRQPGRCGCRGTDLRCLLGRQASRASRRRRRIVPEMKRKTMRFLHKRSVHIDAAHPATGWRQRQ